MNGDLHARVAAAVEAGFAEQIAYTQELVRFASLRGAEHAIQDFVFRAFRSRGLVDGAFCDGPRGDRTPSRRRAVQR